MVPVPEKANIKPMTITMPSAKERILVLKLSNIPFSLILKKAHQRCAFQIWDIHQEFPRRVLIYRVF